MKDYDSLISNQQAIINSCIQMNAKHKEDIEELKAALRQLEGLLKTVESVSSKSNRKVLNIPNLLGLVMKFSLLSPICEALTGDPYRKATSQISDGISDVEKKIKELSSKIDQNNREISSCKTHITSLKNQKATDLKKETEKK